jgi:hypothetical protein
MLSMFRTCRPQLYIIVHDESASWRLFDASVALVRIYGVPGA